jgi:hypothetical protein
MDQMHLGFDFSLSFASEDQDVATELYRLLRSRRASVFCYPFCRSYTLGKSWSRSITPNVYGCATRFVVPIISRYYVSKTFPMSEFIGAKQEESRRPKEFILPLRRDDTVLPGLDPDVDYIDLRRCTLCEAADIMIAKVRGLPGPEWTVPRDWVATFGVAIEDLFENWSPPDGVPTDYPSLCDWLERDLEARLSAANLSDLYQPEPSARSRETLSVRFAFTLEGDPVALEFGDLGWWELLELAPFAAIYPGA